MEGIKEEIKQDDNHKVGYLLIFLIIFLGLSKNERKWNDFKDEIINEDKFLPEENEILRIIEDNIADATKTIKKDAKYFRARLYTPNNDDTLIEIIKMFYLTEENKNELIDLVNKEDLIIENEFMLLHAMLLFLPAISDNEKQIRSNFEKYARRIFKGYDAENSTAPPTDLVPEGRANPAGIRYLYMADSIKTAIYEVRPIIKQSISVAKMKVKQELKIYDLTVLIKKEKIEKIKIETLFHIVGRAFATPAHGDNAAYSPTQYLAKYIKNLGFDGIQFYSSYIMAGGIL